MEQAIFGLVGVLLGSVITAFVTIYAEHQKGKREAAQSDRQYERERQSARDTFQRDSILTLQNAVIDLVKSVHAELDRIIATAEETQKWPARQWETPTAVGWSAALLLLKSSRARVFNEEIRSLATELEKTAGDSIWAKSLNEAEQHSKRLEPLLDRFNDAVARTLPSLYQG
jgi:gas vesicle protein